MNKIILFLLVIFIFLGSTKQVCGMDEQNSQKNLAYNALSATALKSVITNSIKSLGTIFVASAAVGAVASTIEEPSIGKACCSAALCATTFACMYPWRPQKKTRKQLREETLSKFQISSDEARQSLHKNYRTVSHELAFLHSFAIPPFIFKQMNYQQPSSVPELAFQTTFGLLITADCARKLWKVYKVRKTWKVYKVRRQ